MENNKKPENKDTSIEYYFQNNQSPFREIKKNEVLQMPGTIARNAFYVKKGLLRSYIIDDNGKVHITMFAPEGWLISDMESQIMSEPSEIFIDALEDSEVYETAALKIETMQISAKEYPEIIKKLTKRIAVLQRRVLLLMSASAKQRYEHFVETYPQLLNRVPLKMIASYLGMTPEALSNIRSKLRKQR